MKSYSKTGSAREVALYPWLGQCRWLQILVLYLHACMHDQWATKVQQRPVYALLCDIQTPIALPMHQSRAHALEQLLQTLQRHM